MLQELQKKMEEFHMVAPGETVLVGVSGGADSICLLLALYALQKKLDFSLEVIHVEHGIRGKESLLYSSSQWFSITHDFAKYILQ